MKARLPGWTKDRKHVSSAGFSSGIANFRFFYSELLYHRNSCLFLLAQADCCKMRRRTSEKKWKMWAKTFTQELSLFKKHPKSLKNILDNTKFINKWGMIHLSSEAMVLLVALVTSFWAANWDEIWPWARFARGTEKPLGTYTYHLDQFKKALYSLLLIGQRPSFSYMKTNTILYQSLYW